jgi:hypothetical protein
MLVVCVCLCVCVCVQFVGEHVLLTVAYVCVRVCVCVCVCVCVSVRLRGRVRVVMGMHWRRLGVDVLCRRLRRGVHRSRWWVASRGHTSGLVMVWRGLAARRCGVVAVRCCGGDVVS